MVSAVILLGVIFCSFFVVKTYNKPPVNINEVNTEVSISSEKLLTTFNTNEISANSEYVEKVITVNGNIKKITYLNDRYTILLQGENDLSHVMCDMSLSEIDQIRKLKKGESITIKGICKGYLMDVIMLNCILVNN